MDFNTYAQPSPLAQSDDQTVVSEDRFARYAAELKDLEITDDQKRELIENVWSIMFSFVELGFSPPDVWGYLAGDSDAVSAGKNAEVESDETGANSPVEESSHDR